MTRDANKAAPKSKVPPVAKTVAEEKTRLDGLQKALVSAQADSKKGDADAEKALEKSIANETATLKAQESSVMKTVKDSQKKEVARVSHVGKKQVARLIAMRKKMAKPKHGQKAS